MTYPTHQWDAEQQDAVDRVVRLRLLHVIEQTTSTLAAVDGVPTPIPLTSPVVASNSSDQEPTP